MIEQLRELGYRVGWAQGATPEEVREQQRKAGYAWEGDEGIQHADPDAEGYVPEHMVLRDDSHEPTVWWVEGPIKGDLGSVGEPSGWTQKPEGDEGGSVPITLVVQMYVRDDDTELIGALVGQHDDLVAELQLRENETENETSERHYKRELEARERIQRGTR